jgi:hypothetical protein
MSDVAPLPMVSMPAWWDPKDRTLMAGFSSFVPGLLCVDGDSIAFITPSARVFDCPLRETTLSMKGFLQATTCSFRINCCDTIYRIWLTQPGGAKKLSKDQLDGIERDQLEDERDRLEDIEGALNTASDAAGLVSVSLADFFSVLSFIGQAALMHSTIRSLMKARRNYKLLQGRVSGPGEIQIT